ncbi:sigma 54-interacting transcriptional regulator [Anaerospora sp.]|uniref:sigma 54-interacting transcriptional regulator n=1 Tax=Anaerospora sp. TaxID=1960278 RepID=UPI002897FE1C|nr:sigma 54-interacting transcriptional regulator [Anaerospora sp.]
MFKIAFIAPDKQLFLQGKKIIRELGLQDKVSLHLARLKRGIRLAKTLEQQGVEVIVCRGGTARVIIKSRIRIPVVEIPITGQDLAQVFHEAKRITGLTRPKVAMMAFDNMVYDIEILSTILGIDLTIYHLEKTEDIPARIEEAATTDVDLIVGGIKTILLAAQKGLRTHLIRSGDFSVRTAFLEAQKILLARKFEKEQAQKFKALAEYSLEGIISIDAKKIVTVFNPAAEKLLKRPSQAIIGQFITDVVPNLDFNVCFLQKQHVIGQTHRLGNLWITLNIAPIIVDDTVTGAIITFQDITHIQELEAKIRNEVLARRFVAKYYLTDIIGASPQIIESKRIAREIAQVEATVLISGASGTGKELFAQSIHNESPRKNGPFVAVNCAALPANLLESELFGYVEGAFTGATKKGKPGLFEMAHRGTIFLDEISEMDKFAQSRLLRVLQERQVMRLGDNKYIPVDVRIVAATNKNLLELVQDNQFRQDLYYRLKVLTLKLPPLRTRAGDIIRLACHFLHSFNNRHHKHLSLTADAYEYLDGHDWPGNVRELMYFIERLVIIAKEETITAKTIQKYWEDQDYISPAGITDLAPEKHQILSSLAQTNSNITKAAQLLQIDRTTLYRKLRKHKIEVQKTY